MTLSAPGVPLWDDTIAPRRAALCGEIHADVCVVGLGGAGLAAVRELRRLKVDVVGLDAGRVGGGAAGRNGGFLLAGLAPFHHDAVARFGRARTRALHALTMDELERLAAERSGGVARPGSLRIAESPDELLDCDRQYDAMRADDIAVERYDGPEGRGLLIPGDGAFQPLHRCREIAADAERAGVRLHEQSPAVSIEGDRVATPSGAVRCRTVIVAVDGGLERLLPELAPRVRTARLQMLATAPTTEIHLERPVYARWGYDYWQQRPNGAIAMGGARDLSPDTEWTADTTPTARIQDALEDRLRNRLRVRAPITHRWGASVAFTSDGLPVIEQVREGVWAIGGYSGTGNVIGSLLGRGLARLVRADDDGLVRPFIG